MDCNNILEAPEGRYAFRVTIAYREGEEWLKKSRVITTRDWRGGDILTLAFQGYYDDRQSGPRLESVEYLGEGFDMVAYGEREEKRTMTLRKDANTIREVTNER